MPLPMFLPFCPSSMSIFPAFFDPVEVHRGAEWTTEPLHSCAVLGRRAGRGEVSTYPLAAPVKIFSGIKMQRMRKGGATINLSNFIEYVQICQHHQRVENLDFCALT
jgi:hypothetical protein